jgi:predicted dehydrogenase
LSEPVRFGVIGLAHLHVFSMVGLLREAGAEFVAFHGDAAAADGFGKIFPGARACSDAAEILDDPSIALVACADVPDQRAGVGVAALERGKAFFVDKPAAVSIDELARLRRAQEASGRACAIFFSERLTSRATCRALSLVQAGAIGEVVETLGVGPHQIGLAPRPGWFYEPARSGGILGDLASHQTDQFLAFTGSTEAEVVAAQVANRSHRDREGFEDYGSVLLRGDGGMGYARVDWYTPAGLGTWGDGRLTVLGTEGYLEVRKNVDPAGRPGGDHLLLVDANETRHVDCSRDPLAFGPQLLAEVVAGAPDAPAQARAFLAQRLALEAQAKAMRLP